MKVLRRVALALSATVLLAGPAFAADMPPLPETDAAYGGVEELGTNWYLRGDISVLFPANDKTFGQTSGQLDNKLSVGLGVGYDMGDYRFDLTTDYFKKSGRNVPAGSGFCGLNAHCQTSDNFDNQNFLVLFNGYFNLGNWNGFTPYLGAGIGANIAMGRNDPRLWCVENVAGGCAPYSPGWNDIVSERGQRWNTAGALMAGLGYNVDDNLTIDLGYRFVAIHNADRTLNGWENRYENQIRLGFRYKVD